MYFLPLKNFTQYRHLRNFIPTPKRTSGLDELLDDALGEPRLVPGLDADDVAGALREAPDRRPRQPRPVPLRRRAARAQRADLPLRLLVEHSHLAKVR